MPNVHLKPLPSRPPGPATARYEQADHYLLVGPKGNIPPGMNRLSIDTLTLYFSTNHHILTAFDAYTNSELWESRPDINPVIDEEAALLHEEPFDEHGIKSGSSVSMHYNYSENQELLLIELGCGRIITRIRCLSCLICGLSNGGELLEIWVEGVGGF